MSRKTTKPADNAKTARRQKTAREGISITIKAERPVQLTIFDYAAALGVELFPEQATQPAPKPRRRRKAKAS